LWFLSWTTVLSPRVWEQYDIFAGFLSEVPREDLWRLWLALQDGRAVSLDGRPLPNGVVWGMGR
jgi:hypothetical protein